MYEQYINKLESKFSGYENNSIRTTEIVRYVEQFDMLSVSKPETLNILKQSILEVLLQIDYLDSNTIRNELDILLCKMRYFGHGRSTIIRYGKPDDSSYRLIDYLSSNVLTNSIHTALTSDYDTLFFIDDGVNSGHQIISIFQEFMGMNKYRRKTRENHVKPLNPSEREKLKTVRIVIGFIYFNSPVETYIISELQKIGLFNVQIVYNQKFKPKLSRRPELFIDQTHAELFIYFIEKIGLLVLQNNKTLGPTEYKELWTKKRVRRSALGYNNAQQLVVFEYNVPTYTLTALWQTGNIYGREWKGLFCRSD